MILLMREGFFVALRYGKASAERITGGEAVAPATPPRPKSVAASQATKRWSKRRLTRTALSATHSLRHSVGPLPRPPSVSALAAASAKP